MFVSRSGMQIARPRIGGKYRVSKNPSGISTFPTALVMVVGATVVASVSMQRTRTVDYEANRSEELALIEASRKKDLTRIEKSLEIIDSNQKGDLARIEKSLEIIDANHKEDVARIEVFCFRAN